MSVFVTVFSSSNLVYITFFRLIKNELFSQYCRSNKHASASPTSSKKAANPPFMWMASGVFHQRMAYTMVSKFWPKCGKKLIYVIVKKCLKLDYQIITVGCLGFWWIRMYFEIIHLWLFIRIGRWIPDVIP